MKHHESATVYQLPWEALTRHQDSSDQLDRVDLPTHPLHGQKVEALAHRVDSDDVLFEVQGALDPYVVVHQPSRPGPALRHPHRPATFHTLEQWQQERMRPDHDAYVWEMTSPDLT
jgi:hypothetical protein